MIGSPGSLMATTPLSNGGVESSNLSLDIGPVAKLGRRGWLKTSYLRCVGSNPSGAI